MPSYISEVSAHGHGDFYSLIDFLDLNKYDEILLYNIQEQIWLAFILSYLYSGMELMFKNKFDWHLYSAIYTLGWD